MNQDTLTENSRSRLRLEALVERISAADLARSTPEGWTVAALLAHLAFWDQRVLVLLQRWSGQGIDPSPVDAAAVNDAMRPLCLALDPRAATRLSLSAAGAVDAEIERLDKALVERIEEHARASGTQFRLNRSLHRNDHLDQIEGLLQGNPAKVAP